MSMSLRSLTPLLALALLACGEAEVDDPFSLDQDTPVVLVVIDTLRADHLGCYGYELDTSPALDAFAEGAYLFERNTTQCNSTFPSLTSILTGLYAKSHRNYLPVPVAGQAGASEGAASLSQRFAYAGYHCAATISHPTWGEADADAVVLQGWDQVSFIDDPIPLEERPLWAHGAYTNERVFEQLDTYRRGGEGKPLFLWAHYFDPHTDMAPWVYNAPPETRNLFLRHHLEQVGHGDLTDALAEIEPKDRAAWIKKNVKKGPARREVTLGNGRALYDAEIRSCDAEVARLFARLDELGILDEAIEIVMADHGEHKESPRPFGRAATFSHQRLYQGVTHTPFIIRLPGQTEGARIDALVQNIDLAPTLMHLLDLVADPPVDGETLVPLLRARGGQVHEHVFTESSDYVELAVLGGEFKYIDRGEAGAPIVFDLAADPGELVDATATLPTERVASLADAMRAFKPVHTLRMALTPAPEPYSVTLEIDFARTPVDQVLGAPDSSLSRGGHRFTWAGTVHDEQVDLVLILRRRESEMRWRVTHSGVSDQTQAVFVGEHPVGRTTALPVWRPADAPAPPDAALLVRRGPEANHLTFTIPRAAPAAVDVELRYRRPSYEVEAQLVAAEGFGSLEEKDRVYSSHAPKGEAATLTVDHGPTEGEVFTLVRFGGTWVDPRLVDLDGRAVRTDELEFVFPYPVDGRLTSYLLTGHARERTPPGSIVLWLEAGGGSAEIDTSGMDPALVRQLEAIGYLGDQEDAEDEEDE